MSLSVRSFSDMNVLIANNLQNIKREDFDAVVGIPRSGMIPATLLATHLQLPLADVAGFCRGDIYARSTKRVSASRILLVDDSVNKGRAMRTAVETINKVRPGTAIKRFCVYGPYQVPNPEYYCDQWLEALSGPRAFEWNMWKHKRLPRWGFDLDGVFCRDPIKGENDDGPRYINFIKTAEPVFKPSRPVGHIITARLEKYRAITEEQLKRMGVSYGKLHMMPYATKAERMAAGNRGGWKASVIKELNLEFFIESEPKQAKIIHRITGLPVWCTRLQGLINDEGSQGVDG